MENTVEVDKISNSKLPDAIKMALMKNPPLNPDKASVNNTTDFLDKTIFENAAKLIQKTQGKTHKDIVAERTNPRQTHQQPSTQQSNFDVNYMRDVIRDTIRDTVKEELSSMLKDKIILSENLTETNETIIFKIGDTIFKGKISGSKKTK